jgi:hypothetical protein
MRTDPFGSPSNTQLEFRLLCRGMFTIPVGTEKRDPSRGRPFSSTSMKSGASPVMRLRLIH